jgi:hypothetical protein
MRNRVAYRKANQSWRGIDEPIGICIGDSKDFEAFVEVRGDAVGSPYEVQEKFVVEVRPDHFD